MTYKQREPIKAVCPFCKAEMTTRGILGHVRFKHLDRLDEFKEKYYPAMKRQAPESAKPKTPPAVKPKETPPAKPDKAGDDKPMPESFLKRLFDPDADW